MANFSKSFETVVPNPGGKESVVSVCFLLVDARRRVELLYNWMAAITLSRNGIPFHNENKTNESAIELIDGLVAEVRRELLEKYSGSNVDSVPIVAFLETKRDEFVRSLPVEIMKEKRR